MLLAGLIGVACQEKTPPPYDLEGELARVKRAHHELAVLRSRLAVTPRPGAPSGSDSPGGRVQRLSDMEADYDKAFAGFQTAVTGFLNVALNQAPKSPQTLEALGLYADEAVTIARFHLDKGGDTVKADTILSSLNELYKTLGVSPPADVIALRKQIREKPSVRP